MVIVVMKGLKTKYRTNGAVDLVFAFIFAAYYPDQHETSVNVVSKLGQRRKQWANIETTSDS